MKEIMERIVANRNVDVHYVSLELLSLGNRFVASIVFSSGNVQADGETPEEALQTAENMFNAALAGG